MAFAQNRLVMKLRTKVGVRFTRFVGVAAAALATSEILLAICDSGLHMTSTPAALVATFGGAAVSYVLSRWAWERKGKPDVLRETVPFWVISAMVWVILTLATKFGYHLASWMGLQHGFKRARGRRPRVPGGQRRDVRAPVRDLPLRAVRRPHHRRPRGRHRPGLGAAGHPHRPVAGRRDRRRRVRRRAPPWYRCPSRPPPRRPPTRPRSPQAPSRKFKQLRHHRTARGFYHNAEGLERIIRFPGLSRSGAGVLRPAPARAAQAQCGAATCRGCGGGSRATRCRATTRMNRLP